jgi:hypothetical protein
MWATVLKVRVFLLSRLREIWRSRKQKDMVMRLHAGGTHTTP